MDCSHALQSLFVVCLLLAFPANADERPVKIGVMADMSGFASDAGGAGAVTAARLAVEDFDGGVLGKPVEILAADMQNKPDVASSIARKWFDEDGVDMITDIPVSSVALAVQAVARERHKVLIITPAASSDLTGKACSPWTVHLADDTVALGRATANAILAQGSQRFFLITADFAFGAAMSNEIRTAVQSSGGSIVGEVRHPLATADFSSFVLAAQSSGAEVVALANSANDTVNAIKTAHEFGLAQGGQKLASTLLFITDVHALGLDVAKGLLVVTGYYWDRDEATRAFANRFYAATSKMPTKEQANTYAGVKAYLTAVAGAATTKSDDVIANLKAHPIAYFGKSAQIRPDGRAVYDLALYQVKTPEASRRPWDYYAQVDTIKGADAFLPLATGGCPYLGENSPH